MQSTINIKDLTIVSTSDENILDTKTIIKNDKSYKQVLFGRMKREENPETYGTFNDIKWDLSNVEMILDKKVIKFINSRSPKDKQKIKEKLQLLEKKPYPMNFQINSKKVQYKEGFSLRIDNFIFIYDVEDNEIVIYTEIADNKGDVY
jgi:mRNA interferase RelE/StbE